MLPPHDGRQEAFQPLLSHCHDSRTHDHAAENGMFRIAVNPAQTNSPKGAVLVDVPLMGNEPAIHNCN